MAEKSLQFYSYSWENGFITFLVAYSPEAALRKIRKNKEFACPPEVQDEKLSKDRLAIADSNFILTVSRDELEDEFDETPPTEEFIN